MKALTNLFFIDMKIKHFASLQDQTIITMLVQPQVVKMTSEEYYTVHVDLLKLCIDKMETTSHLELHTSCFLAFLQRR